MSYTNISLMSWFIRFRFGAALLAILASFIASQFFDAADSAAPIFVIGLLLLSSNFALLRLDVKNSSRIELASRVAVVLDVSLLTLLLSFSGGPANPFSILYLVYVSLAALIFGERWGWGTVVLSSTLYGLLFFLSRNDVHSHGGGAHLNYHLQGMWLSFVIVAALLAFFQTRLARALSEKERKLTSLSAAQEKLASLTTLAAGAAHELGSPLSTIAVVASELEIALSVRSDTAELVDDARLITSELERCREIIDRMSTRSGEPTGSRAEKFSIGEFVSILRAALHPRINSTLTIDVPNPEAEIFLPRRGLLQAIRSLVENAFHASDGESPVTLRIEEERGVLRWLIEDRGAGMDEQMLRRVGEPFFTTRSPGKGMGLGIFLVRLFAERVGGSMSIDSAPGEGTTVYLEIPTRLN